jgi:hypothetical protein
MNLAPGPRSLGLGEQRLAVHHPLIGGRDSQPCPIQINIAPLEGLDFTEA